MADVPLSLSLLFSSLLPLPDAFVEEGFLSLDKHHSVLNVPWPL